MLEISSPDDPGRVADWAELMLARETDTLSRSTVGSALEAANGSEPSEAFLGDVWRQLSIRQERYAQEYFDVKGQLANRGPASHQVDYQACLAFSVCGVDDRAKLFERMMGEVLKRYLNGDVFVFGWPPALGVPADIGERIRQCAALMCERFVEAPGARYKDRGVDVIGWRTVQERDGGRRSGKMVVLSQCAAGSHWRTKTTELPYAAWTQYVHWAVDPVRAFAIPAIVPDDLWHDVSREAGIVFDRIRIANILGGHIENAELRHQLEEWVTLAVDSSRL